MSRRCSEPPRQPGTSHSGLREYATRVVSPQRPAGGQRRYTRYEIRVIQQVMTMADEGITLQAIRRIIELERQLAAVTRERDELARRLAERL
ncbi:MAG: MerR family transcriptional regulator [Streptosporangiaceae bacterium]